MSLKRRDTPESREHWDHAERVSREVEAEIAVERERVAGAKRTHTELAAAIRTRIAMWQRTGSRLIPHTTHELRFVLRLLGEADGCRCNQCTFAVEGRVVDDGPAVETIQ